jgi:hypothetical protein
MPDWRNGAEYRFPPDFPAYRWAWEFLRRNPEYRNDWATALVRFLASPEDFGLDTPDPAAFDGGWNPDPKHPNFYLGFAEKEKWGVGDLVNPEIDDPYFLAFPAQYGHLYFFHGSGPTTPKGAQFPWAFFDLHRSLRRQLNAVGRALATVQKRQGIKPRGIKPHRDLWPHYLRLLDADLDGRTPKQIADALQEEIYVLDEKKVWDQLQAARRMTKPEGYLDIIFAAQSEK